MKHTVITGSSAGIGLGMAREFLKKGYAVTISGRNETKLNKAFVILRNEFSEELIFMKPCDVRSCDDIEKMWNESCAKIGAVDIWINNAGIGQDFKNIIEFNEKTIEQLIDTNIKGVINCSRIIYKKMSEQGHGAIYNMEGFGSDGRTMAKLSIYGTTKTAVTYFTKSFIKETKKSTVIMGLLSPGMVITDLFLKPQYRDRKEAERFLKIANILADRVETVTPWLVKQIINNKKHGKSFNWLTNTKATGRFIKSMFKNRTLIRESDIIIEND